MVFSSYEEGKVQEVPNASLPLLHECSIRIASFNRNSRTMVVISAKVLDHHSPALCLPTGEFFRLRR